jgi:hypothetical protein
MKLIHKSVPDDWNLVLFGDTHEGTILRDKVGVQKCIDFIATSKYPCYAIHMGDAIEAIKPDDPRYDPKLCTNKVPLEQADEVIQQLMPIKENLITCLLGNHEMKLHLFGNITEYICRQLNVPYGTYSSKVTFRFDDNSYIKGFFHHGFGSIGSYAKSPIQRQTTMLEALKRKLAFKSGDCKIMAIGHTHKLLICQPISELYLTSDQDRFYQGYTTDTSNGKYIHPDNRWYFNTGSFLKLYRDGVSGYADMFGYDPIELGFVLIKIREISSFSIPYIFESIYRSLWTQVF